jgi:hypothetical protein
MAAPTPQAALSGILKISHQISTDQTISSRSTSNFFSSTNSMAAAMSPPTFSTWYIRGRKHPRSPDHARYISGSHFRLPPFHISFAQIPVSNNRSQRPVKNDEPLRFVKFAPHIAYGRISTETLKWTFSLGATVRVTKGACECCCESEYRQSAG